MDADTRKAQPVYTLVNSTDEVKGILINHKRTTETRPFIHGMNLWNFKLLNGAWPENIKELIKESMQGVYHDDLRPWNFIIDGKVHPIDTHDKTWRTEMEHGGLEKCLKLMDMTPDYHDSEFTGLLKTA